MKFTDEQRAFLDDAFFKGGGRGERMRPKKVVRLMKADCRFRVVGAGGRSLVLSQAQVASYFSRKAAAIKKGARYIKMPLF